MPSLYERADREQVACAKWSLAECLDSVLGVIRGKDAGWEPVSLPGLPVMSLEFLVETLAAWLESHLGGQ